MNKKELKCNEKSQNKKSTKACPNHTSNLQSPNSNFSTLTSHFSSLTSDSRGITLIALVITIIVMLILVCVTVTVAINGGLFNTAKDATRKTQFEADKESLLSAVIGAINDNAEVDFDILNDNLPKGFKGDKKNGYTSESGNTFYVEKNGNITTEKPIEPVTTDDYGEYVEYGVDLNGDKKTNNDWKVFYVDEKGHTFIIAADYVTGAKIANNKVQCTEVKTAIQNSNMPQEDYYENIYSYYWTQSDIKEGEKQKVTYHCYDGYDGPFGDGETKVQNEHTSSKIQCSYPDIFMATKYRCSLHVGEDGKGGNANSRCASTLLCSDNWKSLVKEEEGALYAIGGPTVEMWVASWNEKHGKQADPDDGITLTANVTNSSGRGYYVGERTLFAETPTSVVSCISGYEDALYFPHTTNTFSKDGKQRKCAGYWLASPFDGYSDEDCSEFVSNVYYKGWITGSVAYRFPYGLRPVICLNSSNVKLVKE